MTEITDEMAATLKRTFDETSADTVIERYRAALSAVAPLIRAQAFLEAAAVAEDTCIDWHGPYSAQEKIVAAIIALAEKETTNG